jgi:hypothetical protein
VVTITDATPGIIDALLTDPEPTMTATPPPAPQRLET